MLEYQYLLETFIQSIKLIFFSVKFKPILRPESITIFFKEKE